MLNVADIELNGIELVLAEIPTAVLVADGSGRYTFANDAACALLGRDRAELLTLSVRDVSHDAMETEIAWRTFVAERRATGVFAIRRPDGSSVRARFTAICDFVPGHHLSILQDLTDQVRVESILRRDEEFFNRAFRASPSPTTISRLVNGAIVDVNQAFTAVTGYMRSELLGRSPTSLGIWKESSALDGLLKNLHEGAPSVSSPTELVMKNGKVKQFTVALSSFEVDGDLLVIAAYTESLSNRGTSRPVARTSA